MITQNDGGPAFPNIGLVEGITVPWKISNEARSSGLSMRDYFAAEALKAVIASVGESSRGGVYELCAVDAYNFADAMLKERAK